MGKSPAPSMFFHDKPTCTTGPVVPSMLPHVATKPFYAFMRLFVYAFIHDKPSAKPVLSMWLIQPKKLLRVYFYVFMTNLVPSML